VLTSCSCDSARNFKLLDELEEAEKPKGDRGADISLGRCKLQTCSRQVSPCLTFLPACAGLASRDDLFLTNWNASIVQAPVRSPCVVGVFAEVCSVVACALCQGGSAEPRIWFLSLVAGERYPDVPPTIRFTSRVNLDCVDASGVVRCLFCATNVVRGWFQVVSVWCCIR
jgi:hypothetical protein